MKGVSVGTSPSPFQTEERYFNSYVARKNTTHRSEGMLGLTSRATHGMPALGAGALHAGDILEHGAVFPALNARAARLS